MPGRLDLEERVATGGGAERDEQLGEDRDRVGLGVRRDPGDDVAEQLVIDGRGRRRWPARGRRQRRVGWLRVLGRRVQQRECHSAEISATAVRAADSSTIALLAANAAIS